MSDVTLQFQFKVAGTLAAATSVVLSDPTGTYGVKRLDTDATVVADGTAMTAASTGVYRYTFAAPSEGLTYSWWAEVVYDGVTYRFERETTPDGDSGDVFGTRAGIEQKVGARNLKEYVFLGDTDEDPHGDPEPSSIATAIADDLVQAVTKMRAAWREYLESRRVAGATVADVPLGYLEEYERRELADLNENGAAVYAYNGRNIDGRTTEEVPTQIATAMTEWKEGLERLRTGKMLLDYQTAEGIIGPTQDDEFTEVDAPIALAPTVDQHGRTISDPPPRGLYWDPNGAGYRWS